ncbi:DUF452 family protein [bacterium]|nr:DUF452 family protein [bacterium]
MKLCALNKQNNSDLIVFFSGWGADVNMFKTMKADGFDVIMFYDYSDYFVPNFDFSNYKKIYLIAWSMGVLMSQVLELNYDKKIAINGTLLPVHDKFGIPEKIYNLTINNFNDTTKSKFSKKIGLNCELTRTNDELKNELIKIKEYQQLCSNSKIKFDKAYISINDKIFPYENQKLFWTMKNTEITTIDANHYIPFSSWKEILNGR